MCLYLERQKNQTSDYEPAHSKDDHADLQQSGFFTTGSRQADSSSKDEMRYKRASKF
jgi:hypothetical protein